MADQFKYVDGEFKKVGSHSMYGEDDGGPDFDGALYVRKYDYARLKSQKDKIFMFMKDGIWRTLSEISKATGAPEASASACLRDFRKAKFGLHAVDLRPRGDRERGLFEYKLIVNKDTFQE